YPGRGGSGDMPPRPECAPRWHARLNAHLPNARLTLLIGHYAQAHYLKNRKSTLTETVRNWAAYLPQGYLPLPHPSPRNQGWFRKNPWFDESLVPALRRELEKLGLENYPSPSVSRK